MMFWCFSSPALLNDVLGTPRRHFAEAERGSRVWQIVLYPFCDRVRGGSEHAPRDSCRILERRHGLAEIIERGVGVQVERLRVSPPHLDRKSILFAENASRHGRYLAQQFLGFFEPPQLENCLLYTSPSPRDS